MSKKKQRERNSIGEEKEASILSLESFTSNARGIIYKKALAQTLNEHLSPFSMAIDRC